MQLTRLCPQESLDNCCARLCFLLMILAVLKFAQSAGRSGRFSSGQHIGFVNAAQEKKMTFPVAILQLAMLSF